MRRFWSGGDDLEARLRANRAEPRPEFLYAIVGRLERKRRAVTLRVAFAFALTIVGFGILGAFGGIGYASSAAHSLVSSIAGKQGNPGHGNPGATTTTTTTTTTPTTPTTTDPNTAGNSSNNSSTNTPADDQYKPGCGKGDKNHIHTGPPGQVNQGDTSVCPPFD